MNMPNKDKTTNAIAMLKEDHEKVKDLFERFEETNGPATKAKIVSEALMALKVHATVEGEMFKEAKKTEIDLDILGSQMAQLKQKLMRDGVPEDAEAKMIAKCGLRGDSPAKNAQKNLQVPLKKAS